MGADHGEFDLDLEPVDGGPDGEGGAGANKGKGLAGLKRSKKPDEKKRTRKKSGPRKPAKEKPAKEKPANKKASGKKDAGPDEKGPRKAGARSAKKGDVERVVDREMPDGIPFALYSRRTSKLDGSPVEGCPVCTYPFRVHPREKEVQCPHCREFLALQPEEEEVAQMGAAAPSPDTPAPTKGEIMASQKEERRRKKLEKRERKRLEQLKKKEGKDVGEGDGSGGKKRLFVGTHRKKPEERSDDFSLEVEDVPVARGARSTDEEPEPVGSHQSPVETQEPALTVEDDLSVEGEAELDFVADDEPVVESEKPAVAAEEDLAFESQGVEERPVAPEEDLTVEKEEELDLAGDDESVVEREEPAVAVEEDFSVEVEEELDLGGDDEPVAVPVPEEDEELDPSARAVGAHEHVASAAEEDVAPASEGPVMRDVTADAGMPEPLVAEPVEDEAELAELPSFELTGGPDGEVEDAPGPEDSEGATGRRGLKGLLRRRDK